MRYLLLFLPILAFSQDKVYRVHKNNGDTLTLIRYPHSKTITIRDGSTYKYTLPDRDTARFFQSETGEPLEATMVFRKKGGVVVPDPDPVIIDEIVDAEQATFSSNWQYHGATNAAGWRSNTIAFSNVSGSNVKYNFTGFKIEVYAERKSTQGVGFISIDGGPEVEVKFNVAPYGVPVLVYTWTAPTQVNAAHSVVLRVGTGYSLLDYFRVFKVQ